MDVRERVRSQEEGRRERVIIKLQLMVNISVVDSFVENNVENRLDIPFLCRSIAMLLLILWPLSRNKVRGLSKSVNNNNNGRF